MSHFILILNQNTPTVPCEKSKMVSFASSIMKNTVMFPAPSEFLVKLICCMLLDQHQALLVYLNILLSTCNVLWNKDNVVDNQ